jgi:hypothetical protein
MTREKAARLLEKAVLLLGVGMAILMSIWVVRVAGFLLGLLLTELLKHLGPFVF